MRRVGKNEIFLTPRIPVGSDVKVFLRLVGKFERKGSMPSSRIFHVLAIEGRGVVKIRSYKLD